MKKEIVTVSIIVVVVLAIVFIKWMLRVIVKNTTYKAEYMDSIEIRKMGFYEKYIKRCIDVILSGCAIVVFSPIFIVISVLVKVKLGSPILFTQDRPGIVGKDGKETIFKMYKFRTMTDECDSSGELLPDDVRLTKFGLWLRKSSLDELPELLNIFNGTMSIIGPRPQLVRDMVFMSDEQRCRHTAKPGLSGLAQVNGRNAISWEKKIDWDLKYIRNINFIEDIKIVFTTLQKAFIKQEGIAQENMATAEDYGDYLLRTKKIDFDEYRRKQNLAKKIMAKNDIITEKKVLIVASVISFIEWFNKENVEYLHDNLGCEVHIACNFDYMDDTDVERTKVYIEKLKSEGIVCHNIHFARNPVKYENIIAYRQLKALINNYKFDLIHCHTPTVSILTRLAAKKARKRGSVVMYTCHGFHFHKASPRKNWIIYYPIEKICSLFCDYIVTINKEDYLRASKFFAKNIRYIPGVGVDISHIKKVTINKERYRENIGVPKDAIVLISIGELIERKNHEVIIRALGKLKNKNIYYVICGKGPLLDKLIKLTEELKISENIKFLGFRNDIAELCHVADIGAFPSKIEGLGLAGIEIMAAGIPLVSSNVHGILDYVVDGETGYACNPEDVDAFATVIDKLVSNRELRESMKEKCIKAVEPFEIHNALKRMWDIYDEILVEGDMKYE